MSDREDLIALADLFIRNERLLAEFYTLCGETFPAFKESWEILRGQEDEHARIFEEIKRAIEASPDTWSKGKYSVQALQITIDNLTSRMRELREGKANKTAILHFLMDTEQSLIESEMNRAFVTSDDRMLLQLQKLQKVQNETVNHKNLLRTIVNKR